MDERVVRFIFCDGGVILKNPSSIGGTWAWCGVSATGEHLREVGGYLLPGTSTFPGWAHVASAVVSNADTEFYAVLRALECMPRGWTGTLVSDSQSTLQRLQRITDGDQLMAFRTDWQTRAERALAKHGPIRLAHVAGHPSREDLVRGYVIRDERKVRVSRHQVWCDERCSALNAAYQEQLDCCRALPDLPHHPPQSGGLAMSGDMHTTRSQAA